ncbi:DUF3800 domain-containing protein [Bacillus subtilis]|uniref:DUF3800 domain-containing protein n=1 Tax=Bacillus subtilis TaxID=1423 RepID=UPI00034890D8|nr:DUF3800 domain-containing protein [Bacillus subtilis]KIN49156.1 hypothetical protein B4073_4304 [Bacillus subtilis]MED1759970.1 DUF3800 domain-containing protein [Bacillus subtilis]QCY75633.1 hypothetical protein CAH07_14565 [Bacillus subtilis]
MINVRYFLVLDDSGQLHPNYPFSDVFVYGGILVREKDYHGINFDYTKFIDGIRKQMNITEELKTSMMKNNLRRRVLNKLKRYNFEQVFVGVKVSSLVRIDFADNRRVTTYKNYMIRRLIDELMQKGKIPDDCTCLNVHIDNQNVAHSSIDSLEGYLINYFNEDNLYNVHKEYTTTSFKCDFRVKYRDSSTSYMIQAADILANTKSHVLSGKTNLRKLLKEGYTILKLPNENVYKTS